MIVITREINGVFSRRLIANLTDAQLLITWRFLEHVNHQIQQQNPSHSAIWDITQVPAPQ
jgi:hypothetical protein